MTEDEIKKMAVQEAQRVLGVHAKTLAVKFNETAIKYVKGLTGLSQEAKNDIVYSAAQFYVYTMEETFKRQEGEQK